MMRIRVAAQNSFFTQFGVKGGVIVISGSWFLGVGAPGVIDLRAFCEKTQAEVEARLQVFQNGHPGVDPQTAGIIVMDIEDPKLGDMHLLPDAEQSAIIKAVRIRVAATRAKFPRAKLSLYGIVNPDPRGSAADPYASRLATFVQAGKVGMFDGLDYLSPVLYLRFGPTDRDWDTLAAYTQMGITGSRMIRKSAGVGILILPLLSLWIANGNSKHNQQIVLDLPVGSPVKATLGVQLELLRGAGVKDAVVWAGEDSDLILHEPNPHDRTVSQHLKG
jgi:hypothetical protein